MNDKFIVDSIEKANWCFRKLKEIDDKEKEIEQLADKELERIERWRERELEAYQGSKEHFQGMLELYYRTEKEKNDKFKLSTPYGQVTSRKQQPKFIRDDEKLLGWIRKSKPEMVKIKESPDWESLKKDIIVDGDKAITTDGEVVEGVEVVVRDYTVNIKVD